MVDHEPEIGDDIFNFFSFIERQSPIDDIREVVFAQSLLEDTALRVCSIENGKGAEIEMLLVVEKFDFINHRITFLLVGCCLVDGNRFSILIVRERVFLDTKLVFRDDAVRRVDDILRRAVVLLQLEDFIVGIYLVELKYIANAGSSEGVYALCVVAHNTESAVDRGKLIYDGMLCEVCVLILIYKQELESRRVFLEDVRMFFEEDEGEEKNVVEIHGVGRPEALRIDFIDFSHRGNIVRGIKSCHLLVGRIIEGCNEFAFGHAYSSEHQ